MVLQALISLIYGVVESSWMVASVFTKFVLTAQIGLAASSEGKFFDNLQDEVNSRSKNFVAAVVASGAVLHILGVQLSVFPELFSYGVALAYFAYLFWEF